MTHQNEQFDIEGAKAAGHSDADIAAFLAKDEGFDIEGARASGHDDANIIKFLTTGETFRDIGQAAAFGQGLEGGFVDIISTVGGAPVDIVQSGITAITGREGDPFAGSRSIRRGLSSLGIEQEVTEEQLPPSQRSALVAGEVIGGSIPFAGIGGAIKGIGQSALKKFLAVEAATTLGAAQAGAVAELADPGDKTTRFLAEVAGGFFNPAGLIAKGLGKASSSLQTLIKSFSKSGRQDKAAEIVRGIIEEAGENPQDIIKLLDKADIQGVKLTAGQKTGSNALLKIEKALAAKSGRFAGEAEDLASNSLTQLRTLVDNLTKSGDPQALRAAAKLRASYFDDLLTRRIEDAGQDALEARAKIGPSTKADLPDISTKAKDILSDALEDARKVENEIWGKIPKETRVPTEGLLKSVDVATNKFLLPSENLPTIVQDEIIRILAKGTNAGEALKFRSRLLRLSRSAAAKGDFNDKAIFDTISDGILGDLDKIAGADEARAFSRALHERFTSTFAGEALAKTGRGGERIPAEVMLERAFGSGGTKGELRLGQLAEAADFPRQIFGEPMRSAQEKFLSVAAQNTVDSAGRVNPAKLSDFIAKNQNVLDKFPDLKSKLSSAVDAEDTFKGVEAASKRSTNIINKETAFANLIKTDDPVVAVANVLGGKNVRRNYTQIAKLAKKSGQGSLEGLRSATIKTAFNKAYNSSGDFSFQRLNNALTKGVAKEERGLLSLMRQNGVIDAAGANRLKTLVKRGIEIENALGNQKKLDKLMENPDGLFDLATRIMGAKLGSAGVVGRSTAGTSLIAASAGSRLARNFAQKLPATKVTDVLIEAASDPKFMSTLLKKTKTIKQRAELERQINAFLLSAGFQFEEQN